MTARLAAGCLICAALVLGVLPGPLSRRLAPVAAARSLAMFRRAVLPLGAVGVVAAAAVAGGPVAALLVTAAGALLAHRRRSWRVQAAVTAAREGEVEALGTLAAELRAGRQPLAALAVVEPSAGAMGAALAGARAVALLGGDVGAALSGAAAAGGALQRLAAAWQISERTGAPLAEVVSRVEVEARVASVANQRADVELAGARATGAILALLPLLGVGLGQAMGAHPAHFLLHTAAGALCCGCGLVLEIAGGAWIARLAASATAP